MKKLQCQDEDCKTIFDEDKVFEWVFKNPDGTERIVLKCPKCRGKLKEYILDVTDT